MKQSDFSRMTPAQKEAYIARMTPIFRALKKTVQQEIRDYVLKSPKLSQRFAAAVQ